MTITTTSMSATEPAERARSTSAIPPAGHTGQGLRRFRLGGIRARLVLGSVLLVAAALAASIVVTRQVLLVRLDNRIEQDLADRVTALTRLATTGVDPQRGAPFGTDAAAIFDAFLTNTVPRDHEAFLTIVGSRPYLATRGAPVELSADRRLVERWSKLRQPLRLDVGHGKGAARTLAVPLLGEDGATVGVFVVAVFPAEEQADVSTIVGALGAIGLVVLVAASLASLSLARRVLRPAAGIAAVARRVSGNDLDVRFEVDGSDELSQLGLAFNTMLDRLEEGFGNQRDMIDDVAHELRTPITIMRGHLELLGDDPEERARTVALCLEELDRMSRYVDDLLVVATARRPDFLRLGPVDAADLIDDLRGRLAALGDRDWVVESTLRPGMVLLDADEHRLSQGLLNLLGNAVQHTEPGERIELRAVADDAHVVLEVRDHGPGIDPEIRDRLFARFSRASGSRASRPEGTGLGLAIVAAIAHAHGGTVEGSNMADGGARFRLTLPRRRLDEDPEEQ